MIVSVLFSSLFQFIDTAESKLFRTAARDLLSFPLAHEKTRIVLSGLTQAKNQSQHISTNYVREIFLRRKILATKFFWNEVSDHSPFFFHAARELRAQFVFLERTAASAQLDSGYRNFWAMLEQRVEKKMGCRQCAVSISVAIRATRCAFSDDARFSVASLFSITARGLTENATWLERFYGRQRFLSTPLAIQMLSARVPHIRPRCDRFSSGTL